MGIKYEYGAVVAPVVGGLAGEEAEGRGSECVKIRPNPLWSRSASTYEFIVSITGSSTSAEEADVWFTREELQDLRTLITAILGDGENK